MDKEFLLNGGVGSACLLFYFFGLPSNYKSTYIFIYLLTYYIVNILFLLDGGMQNDLKYDTSYKILFCL